MSLCFILCVKIYAFIDSQNLNLSVRSAGWILDFKKFLRYLKDKYHVQKTYLFIGYVAKNKKLYKFLGRIGYKIIFKPTLENKDGDIKGNCDGELILHCMIEYKNFDKAIIVSGDGDFYCLAEYLKNNNKLLKIGIPNKHKCSTLLKKFMNYFFYVNDFRKRLEYKKGEAS